MWRSCIRSARKQSLRFTGFVLLVTAVIGLGVAPGRYQFPERLDAPGTRQHGPRPDDRHRPTVHSARESVSVGRICKSARGRYARRLRIEDRIQFALPVFEGCPRSDAKIVRQLRVRFWIINFWALKRTSITAFASAARTTVGLPIRRTRRLSSMVTVYERTDHGQEQR